MVALLKFGMVIYPWWKVWGEIIYPFLNFSGSTVEVWEWLIIPAGIKVNPC